MSLFVSRRLLHRCLPVAFSSVFTNPDIKMPSAGDGPSPQAANAADGANNGATNGATNDVSNGAANNANNSAADDAVPAKRARVTSPVPVMSNIKNVTVPYVKVHEKAIAPFLGSDAAAGHDLHSVENVVIPAGGQALIATGLKIALPDETYGRIAPRSGLAAKYQIDVGAGVVDADYRGEVKVLLMNRGKKEFKVSVGDRIAQLIVQEIATYGKPVMADTVTVQIHMIGDTVTRPRLDMNAIKVFAVEGGVVPARGMHTFNTGAQIALPLGYYGHASPLTNLAINHGIDLYAGVIDADYRGELKVLLSNNSDEDFTVKPGDAVMQILVEKIANATYEEVDVLPETVRGGGGFGSTGITNPNAVPAETENIADPIAALIAEDDKLNNAVYRPNPHKIVTDRPVTIFPVAENGIVPIYGSPRAAGVDLFASEATTIPAGGRGLVSTGTVAIVANGYYARIAPRSGLALKHCIDVGAGVQWTSEEGTTIKILLFNHGTEPFVVNPCERIAQVISERIAIPYLSFVKELPSTERGQNGFGSTGVSAVPAPEGGAVPEGGDAAPVEQAQ
uniref:dUTP diphosphatase n=1 Tax=Panagrellus redivivus TaxID=6233 RepID=A0A7E4VG98_PANRE